jgi:hypothetical protein
VIPDLGTGGARLKQSLNVIPNANPVHTVVVHTALNLDGATLARAVEGDIAELHELPDSASTANGVAYPTLNDWNPSGN